MQNHEYLPFPPSAPWKAWSPLIQEDEKYQVVPEASDAVQRGHGHDERKHVVDERVDRLVRHHPPRHVRHALQLIRARSEVGKPQTKQNTTITRFGIGSCSSLAR